MSLYKDGDVPTDFIENVNDNMPDLVMVQSDPMTFMSRARQFAISNIPLL